VSLFQMGWSWKMGVVVDLIGWVMMHGMYPMKGGSLAMIR